MKHLMTVLALSVACLSTSAFAADAAPVAGKGASAPMKAASGTMAGGSCEAMAAEKKLSGAAKNSYVQKCQKDAGADASAMCNGQAAEKKLAGAAKNSFVKKCMTDAGKA